MATLTALGCIFGISLVIAWLDRRVFHSFDPGAAWLAIEALPRELRTAVLHLSETPISTKVPIALNGIPDQVYRTWRGKLVVVDTKCRLTGKVVGKDILQLSVYRVILRHCQPLPVANHGYIRLVYTGKNGQRVVSYQRVRLCSESRVVLLCRNKAG